MSAPDAGDRLYRAWLAMSEHLTQRGRERLMDRFGSVQAIYEGFGSSLVGAIGEKAYDELRALRDKGLDKLELALARSGINICVKGDGIYPELLSRIADAPDALFYLGNMAGDDERAIAIVGSRRETRYGREQAFRIARELAAQGVAVVSGLAYGIDTAAHKGALEGGGRTVAVLGSGLLRLYPPENAELAQKIIESGGAVVSEFPPRAEPLAFRFPYRNRVVSGLSHGVLLVEAREKSGTLITVGHALEQGREVFALPGPVDQPASAVPNRLLREGARLVTCAADLMEDMGWAQRSETAQTKLPIPDLTGDERRLYDALCAEPLGFAQLQEALGLPISTLNVAITQLELTGLIEALPGRMFRRTGQ